MSLDGTEKAHVTCKERERDKKEYAKKREGKEMPLLFANNMNHTKSLYMVILVRFVTLCENNKRRDARK